MRKWFLAFAGFQALDAALTLAATQCFGFVELNPLMALALSAQPAVFLAVKALGTAAILRAASRGWSNRSMRKLIKLGAVLMGLVCVWNFVGILLYVA